jgi:hypothetical protein
MECAVCGRERYTNQVHMPSVWQDAMLQQIVERMHHEGCGGRPKLVELVTNVAGGRRRSLRDHAVGWRKS